jgi:trehalose-6-phosphate synthase
MAIKSLLQVSTLDNRCPALLYLSLKNCYTTILRGKPKLSWYKRSGSRKADEALTVKELRVLVQRIQDKFGSAVIDHQEIVGASSIPIDQRLALWKASDVFMCTPIREGLNHWPMECIYTYVKARPGVIIASEFIAVC